MNTPAKNFYPDVDPNPNFAKLEEQVIANWKKDNTFCRSVDERAAKKDGKNNEFIFYDGPPFANGLPHYGHLLTGYVKDLFARYQTMKGKRVERRFGWDCHGLPAEMGSEKELGISGRAAITNYGIGKFNEHCRTSVMKYTHEWEYYVTRQARWVDFQNDYKTMDQNFMESVLWAFKQLYDKGLVYEAYRVMPYSWAAETPLSNFETKLDNSYRERADKAITVAFELKEAPKGAPKADKYYILAWTTTPWTLPSNLALAVNKEMEYVSVLADVHSDHSRAGGKQDSSPACVKQDSIPPLAGGAGGNFGEGKFSTRNLDAMDKAEALRKNPTDAEKKLWQVLSGKKLDGFKFRRQQPMGEFIADFVCMDSQLIIEVDGSQHSEKEQREYDDRRTAFLNEMGFRVLRFTNLDVLQNIEGVAEKILAELSIPPVSPRKRGEESVERKQVEENAAGGKAQTICYILSEKAVGKYTDQLGIKQKEQYVFSLIPGSNLIGLSYHPLFPYFKDHKNAFRILDGSSFVTDGDGTGIVHMAPGFGEDDQKCCEANDIELVVPVDGQGKYTDAVFDIELPASSFQLSENEAGSRQLTAKTFSLKGLNVIADTNKSPDEPYKPEQLEKYGLANLRIITYLKNHYPDGTNRVIKEEEIKHNYPHCWRTDKPLIYRAMPSWYVEVTKFRDRAVELNKQINWIPDHIRDGQMGHMLATAPDWSISRNRFWGTPIPIWRSKSGKMIAIGSIKELEELSGQKVKDLHRPYIDEIKITKDGEEYTRVEDVFDCWFESGSMPFAQVHYPFENKEWFETHFPADFITEYVGQTRGWFNTLIMLSTALFDKPPFKNCICHGVVLDAETGLKYSKRLKNYKDPKEVMDQYGADALRWLMIASPVMRGADLAVDPEGKFIRDVVRLAIKPIWNAYNFFCLYANADGVKASELWMLNGEEKIPATNHQTPTTNLMDQYILAKCKSAVSTIEQALDAYDTPTACDAVMQFFDVLNNWYIRRSKERFWSENSDADPASPEGFAAASKQAAYDTLYTVLHVMCRAAAPLLPLTTEEIYRGLTGEDSVHLAEFPSLRGAEGDAAIQPKKETGSPRGQSSDMAARDDELVKQMDWIRDICNAALSIRNKANIRVRQPLARISVIASEDRLNFLMNDKAGFELLSIIKDEINVQSHGAVSNKQIEQYATHKISINNPILGKRLPEKMKQIIPASKKGEWKQLPNGSVEICGETLLEGEYTLQLEPKPEYKNSAAPLSTNDALVILDLTITPELEAEGIARDVVRMVQQARKDSGFHVSDRISLVVNAPEPIAKAVGTHKEYIAQQTLSVSVGQGDAGSASHTVEAELEGQKITIGLSKAA